MPTHASLIEHFLLAARSSEMRTLDQLAHGCQLVAAVCELVHELQRERGISNIYLASGGARFGSEREEQRTRSDTAERHFYEYLRQMQEGEPSLWGSARLYHRTARVLLQLDDLAELRRGIRTCLLDTAEATQAWSDLIAGLLAIVFEAADIATDAEISRALVALFHFLQAKEHTGQERAWGSVGFASGSFTPELKARLLHLRESQQRCLDVFIRFTGEQERVNWAGIETSEETAELARLRRMVDGFDPASPIPADVSEIWFAVATSRIDHMRRLEQQLSAALMAMAQARLQQARLALQDNRSRLQEASEPESGPVSPLSLLLESTNDESSTMPVSGSVRALYDLLQEQAEHLQEMSDQLEEARSALTERKLIERAKGLLMQYQGLSEADAFAALRRSAMEGHCRLADVASRVIGAAEKLKG
ncbi:nitrate regulatory protein [Marinobacterium sediminicola]|uniref:ANTAR domain-containing protein n=1 Tax=Marinobacterium sediminicola TaxID=518898 RepID=A0ABY1S253_9GAMM|nr:nitrate regulatory protein [Marinobacterium sediminicola]ULG68507.1 nitrate- and nitrite sensing domain-containing protein [Marinobacterium sediminicola]SMR76681.1 ANTAR domain-containing protein [Marinobacterium sediminicola]